MKGTSQAISYEATDLKAFLDRKVDEYNRPSFIATDPISIPHSFTLRQDIEIAAFFTAIFSWGNRTTIIRKSTELMELMDNAPHQFMTQHTDADLMALPEFRHRTFNMTDLLYFISFFKHHYSRFDSLEDAFLLPDKELVRSQSMVSKGKKTSGKGGGAGLAVKSGFSSPWPGGEASLSRFYDYFFSLEDAPTRTFKHIATPARNSACKRINMFLRWMVRDDGRGVDFGLWDRIPASELICPLDLHVARVARRFNLLSRPQSDWRSALELTGHLAEFDPEDPTKYDFALFGLGSLEKY